MKPTEKVIKSIVQGLTIVMAIASASCVLDRHGNSHFGHGYFRCFYLNQRTGHLFVGTTDEQKEATRLAKNACRADSTVDEDKMQCAFQECLFK